MKRRNITTALFILMTFSMLTLALPQVQAQEQSQQQDKTGTNPVNFTKDIRLYSEYSWLNTAGDGNQSLTTAEFRTPFADGKWQWRVRARFNALNADLNDDGVDEIDESGFGDVDMRFLTVPYIDMDKGQAVAVGLEAFFDTASDDALGSGNTALGPQVFYVKFLPTGLFAPALQYKFSVDEATGRDETDQFLIDLNYLRMAKDKQSWFFADPQIIIDNEADIEYSVVDFEFGVMMSKWTDLQGQSFWIRPSFGIGADRPVDYSVEVGYKIVGF